MARRSRSNAPTATLGEDSTTDESSALRRGLEVMRLISPGHAFVTLDAVVEELNTTRVTAQKLIATLVEHRLLRPSRDPDHFFADISALTIGRAYIASVEGLESLGATMRTFQDVERVSVTAWVRERTEGICLASSGTKEPLVGSRFELDQFCAGHALMWSADSAVRIALLERFARGSGERSMSKPGALYGSFHQLETEGYCTSEGTPPGSERVIAFPFRAYPNGTTFAFSVQPLQPGSDPDPRRAKELVRSLSDLVARVFAH